MVARRELVIIIATVADWGVLSSLLQRDWPGWCGSGHDSCLRTIDIGCIRSVVASSGDGVGPSLAVGRDDVSENAASAPSLQLLKVEVDQLEHQLAAIGYAEFLSQ